MSNCKCTSSGMPLGQAPLDSVIKDFKKILFKEKLNADGSIPFLDMSGAAGSYDAPYWATYLQAANPQDRYFVTGYIDDVTPETQDGEYLETSNKVEFQITPEYIQVTMKVFGSEGVGSSTDLMRRYERLLCLDLGINIIDGCDHLVGQFDDDKMKLIPINSMKIKPMPAVKGESIAHIEVSFRIPPTFRWSNVDVFVPNEEAGDLSLSELRAVVPLNLVSVTTTDASADVDVTIYQSTSTYASGQTQVGTPHVSLVAGDFTVTVNGAPVVVSSLVNNMDGTYTLTLASALATADVVVISATQAGYELAPVTTVVA
jgi:hypothetical protein